MSVAVERATPVPPKPAFGAEGGRRVLQPAGVSLRLVLAWITRPCSRFARAVAVWSLSAGLARRSDRPVLRQHCSHVAMGVLRSSPSSSLVFCAFANLRGCRDRRNGALSAVLVAVAALPVLSTLGFPLYVILRRVR